MVTDASGYGLGAVLKQGGKIVAYESRSMTPAERNHGVGEQELLAVIHALTVWRCYLEGFPAGVDVITDHAPNTFMPTKAVLSRRQARWSEFLQRFPVRWCYQPGKSNVADPLSRAPHLKSDADAAIALRRPITEVGSLSAVAAYPAHFAAMSAAEHSGAVPAVDLMARVRVAYVAATLFKDGARMRAEYPGASEENALWYNRAGQLIVPADPDLRRMIISEANDPACCGHAGISATTERLKPFYCWTHGGTTLNQAVTAYVLSCRSCQRNKGSDHLRAGMAQPLQVPDAPWLSISMDFISGLPKTRVQQSGAGGHDSALVIAYRFTKAVHVVPCHKTCTAHDVALMLFQNVYRLHGIPHPGDSVRS